MENTLIILKSMIKGMLLWSDRIGSDEICELQEMLKIINNQLKTLK